MTSLLTARGLTKSFGETRALRNVSIDVEPGKVYTVLGENGSGKSTLVKTLSGILLADSGQIEIDGKTIRRRSPADMIARGISVVLQEVLIAGNRSGIDNVLVGRDGFWSYRNTPAQKRSVVEGWVGKLSTRPIDIACPASELPLNQQQVLVVARGFAAQPRILILDEVTAALDLADRDRVFGMIRAFCGEGGAVIFVSHRMPEIVELSDVVFVMHNGAKTAQLSGTDINPQTLLAHLTQEGRDDE
ncbi:ATP-binding cassette domain-containing protein [Hoeflea sp.]|uniref:ATP-binding cassette domain-containing protein n=1 Tax=Hoeflea sp. TaxID=1940281 RepID=UPI003B017A21